MRRTAWSRAIPRRLSNYVIYGREVLAVADGTVVSSRNDLPEQVPGALPPGMTIDQADGNFVVLDIGAAATCSTPTCSPAA